MELGDDSALVKALLPSVFFLIRGYGGKVPGSFRNTYKLENSESAVNSSVIFQTYQSLGVNNMKKKI